MNDSSQRGFKYYLRYVRALAPAIGAFVAIAIATWTFIAFTIAFPDSGLWQRFLATLVTFAGGYLPPDQTGGPTPPTTIAIPATAAFLITIATAASVVTVLSRRARNALLVWFTHRRLAVVGSGNTAAAILNSALAQDISTVLITDDEHSPAGIAAAGVCPVLVVPNLDTPTVSPAYKRVSKRALNIVVATDSTAENLNIREHLRTHRPDANNADDFRSLIAVVTDPHLAELLRPTTIRKKFDEEDVTCPTENVAEHICHLIDAAATSSRAIRPRSNDNANDKKIVPLVDKIAVQVIDVEPTPHDSDAWPLLAETIELWVRRLAWGRTFLAGDELPDGTFNPIIPLEVIGPGDELPATGSFTVQVVAGPRTGTVAYLLRRRAIDARTPDLTIVVADTATARAAEKNLTARAPLLSGQEWLSRHAPLPESPRPAMLVVDPVVVGLDANLVVDAITLQWARMFAQTYDFMYAGKWSAIAWEPGAPLGDGVLQAERDAIAALTPEDIATNPNGRRGAKANARRSARKKISNRYSSQAAVNHMLELLNKHDFQLVRCHPDATQPPPAPQLDADTVREMAAEEHAHWTNRTWIDRSRATLVRRIISLNRYRGKTWEISEFSDSYVAEFTFDQLTADKSTILDAARAKGLEVTDAFAKKVDDFGTLANYNRRIITQTYPAIAATFGYAIVRHNSTTGPS